jgi:hypothetical protein
MMAKTLFVLLFLAFAQFLPAQVYVGEVNINELPGVEYISARFIPLGRYVAIDYGQPDCNFALAKQCRVFEDGDFRRFNSQMDMLNYLVSNGWDYVETQAGFSDADEQTPVLFRRKRE